MIIPFGTAAARDPFPTGQSARKHLESEIRIAESEGKGDGALWTMKTSFQCRLGM